MRKSKSFVLMFALAMLSLVVILTHQLIRTVYIGYHFDQSMVEREHAEMLALGGLNLAIAQLTIEKPQLEKDKKKKLSPEEEKKKKKKEFADFLKRTLPNMNRWQVFPLTELLDGIDGEVKICITCEQGKLNINNIYDFKKSVIKKPYKKLLERIKVAGKKRGGQFVKKLEAFLKKRNRKIDDISELHDESLEQLKTLFYQPPERTEKIKQAKPNKEVALQDLFTIWSPNEKLEALYLSDALCALLDFRRPRAYDAELRKEKYKGIIKGFDPSMDQNTKQYWNKFGSIYDMKRTFKIDDLKIFSPKFEPKVYSVLSSGKVGSVEQRLLAVIREVGQKKETNKKTQFEIIRVYWI